MKWLDMSSPKVKLNVDSSYFYCSNRVECRGCIHDHLGQSCVGFFELGVMHKSWAWSLLLSLNV